MYKKLQIFILCSLFFLPGCEDVDLFMITDAASDAVTAITLDDEEVNMLAREAAASSDSKHKVASLESLYHRRLQKLVSEHGRRDGQEFNFKVYLTQNINAFAMADGTIRVYSGLMDLMNDEELLFVIGHEMGHVVKKHSRKKVVVAYASSAVRKGFASQDNEVGQLARSLVGVLGQQLTNAQFSQHEEKEADQYGVQFMEEQGVNRLAAVSALNKLADLARRKHTVLSSHPDPEFRAKRIAMGHLGDEDEKSFLEKVVQLFTVLFKGAVQLLFVCVNWLLSFF